MNSVRIASGTVTLIALVLLGAWGSDQALRPLATDAVILAFGDSLTGGTGTGTGRNESYP